MTHLYAFAANKTNGVLAKRKLWNNRVFLRFFRYLKDHKDNFIVYTFILMSQRMNERYERRLFKSVLKKDMNIIDIGANFGLYAIQAAKITGLGGHVFAFEPEPSTNHVLKKRIELNGVDNVSLFSIALSDTKGTEKLYFDEANVGGHSFSENNPYKTKTYIEVETDTLDNVFKGLNLLDKIDIIKIDTQGAEGLVMMGGKNLLMQSKPMIFLELWPNGMENFKIKAKDMLKFFKEMGYSFGYINKLEYKLSVADTDKILELCAKNKHGNDQLDLVIFQPKHKKSLKLEV